MLSLVILTAACGAAQGPAAPSGGGAAAVKLDLTGVVYSATSGQPSTVSTALVEVITGANQGRSVVSDAAGRYRLDNMDPGTMTLRASAPGYVALTRTVVLSADTTSDFALAPDLGPGFRTVGRVVDVLTQAGLAGVTLSGGSTAVVTDGTGSFTMTIASGGTDPLGVVLTGAGIVERRTALRVPGPDAMVSLIASGFDLRAFDEMFRVSMLLRWTTAPPLRIETRAAQFVDLNATALTMVADAMSEPEYASLVADLSWALPQLTGGTFTGFAEVARTQAAPDATIPLLNSGVITVARVVGLTAGSGFWGYSRWRFASNGTITAGLVMLDRDFERSGSPSLRSLRAHELGHALGYNHVTVRSSVMNSSGRIEPNDFDRDAARIAFARSPGNRSPDVDPPFYSTNRASLTETWSAPIR